MSNGNPGDVNYDEDIFVGYRHFDRNPETILYPFGFGLSYTSFEYSDLNISNFHLSREERGGQAIMTIEIDNLPPDSLVDDIRSLPNVTNALLIRRI